MPNDDHSTPADNAPDRWWPEEDGDPPAWLYPPRFEPDPKDERDLRWYFAQGPTPHGLTTKQHRRWREIDLALAGGGHRLFLCFTRGGPHAARTAAEVGALEEIDHFCCNDPGAEEYREMTSGRAPVDLDEERRWRRWAGLVARYTVPLLQDEYASFVRRRESLAAERRPGRPRRDRNPQIDIELPFDTVKDVLWVDTAERAPRVYWREVEPGEGEAEAGEDGIVRCRALEPGSFRKDVVHHVGRYTDRPMEKLADLLASGIVSFTTWGAIRLPSRRAVEDLFPDVNTFGVAPDALRLTVERVAAERVAEAARLRAWCGAALEARPRPPPKDRGRERRRLRGALLDRVNAGSLPLAGVTAGVLRDLWRPASWAEDDEKLVEELARALGVTRLKCASLLNAEGVRGKRVSVFWLSTDAGRRFVGRAQAEAKRAFSARSRRGSKS